MPPKKSLASQDTKSNKKQKIGDSDVGSGANDSSRQLSREEEEEMSSALIAQLLAQEGGGGDHGYYAEYNNDYQRYGDFDMSDEDEDYWDGNYRPKSKSRLKKAKSRPKKKAVKQSGPKATIATAEPASTSSAITTTTTTTTTTAVPVTPSTTAPAAVKVEGSTGEKTESAVVKDSGATKPSEEGAKDSQSVAPAPESKPVAASTPAPAPVPKAAPKEKKSPKELAPGINTGTYSEDEERRFVEALELFGRDWPKVEEHVRTRDSNSIRSHAQKHFIKLFRDNVPLPAKILETGPGYTLSGRDLDPYSAAARPYLAQRLLDDPSLLPAQSGTMTFNPPDPSNPQPKKPKEKPAPKSELSSPSSSQAKDKEKDKERQERPSKEAAAKESKPMRLRPVRESPRSMDVDASSYRPVGRTDYSKSRLRSVRERTSINYNQMANADLDPLTMVKCEPFCGKPNSGVTGCQPFTITVRSNVLLGMDFHAHLMTTEVIGFLAGAWDPKTKTIHIQANFPCRSLPTGQDHVNVEMDPTSEFEVRQEIEKRNMRIVGWYHSHPTFTPDPSLVDIENQASYQRLFKDELMNEEPFVGAIVGPYDSRLPGLSSVINWFYISQSSQERGFPKRLIYDLIEDTSLPEEDACHWLKLVDEYRDSPERVNFNEQWRQGESETNLQKLLVSLGRRMPWLRDQLKKEQEEKQKEDEDGKEPEDKVADQTSEGKGGQGGGGDTMVSQPEASQQIPVDVEMTDVCEEEKKAEVSEQSQETTTASLQDSELAEATSAIVIHSSITENEDRPNESKQDVHQPGEDATTTTLPSSSPMSEEIVTVPHQEDDGAPLTLDHEPATPASALPSAMSAITTASPSSGSSTLSTPPPFEGGVAMSRTGSNVSRESMISIGSESSGRQLVVASLKLRGILQDEFLLRVEQELSTWEPFLG